MHITSTQHHRATAAWSVTAGLFCEAAAAVKICVAVMELADAVPSDHCSTWSAKTVRRIARVAVRTTIPTLVASVLARGAELHRFGRSPAAVCRVVKFNNGLHGQCRWGGIWNGTAQSGWILSAEIVHAHGCLAGEAACLLGRAAKVRHRLVWNFWNFDWCAKTLTPRLVRSSRIRPHTTLRSLCFALRLEVSGTAALILIGSKLLVHHWQLQHGGLIDCVRGSEEGAQQ